MDISGEWITGDNGLVANWTTTVNTVATHQVQLAQQTVFGEVNDHIQRWLRHCNSHLRNANNSNMYRGLCLLQHL